MNAISKVGRAHIFLAHHRHLTFPKLSQDCTLFCDFDGPIVDVSDRYYSTYKLGIERTKSYYGEMGIVLNLEKLTKQDFWQMKQERVRDETIATRSGLTSEQIPFFIDSVRKFVNHPILLQQDKIQPGVHWALRLLRERGIKLVLVTLRSQSRVADILSDYNLKHLFSEIYGTDSDRCAYQNNAELKTELLKKAIAARPKTLACMVGDTEADILAAKASEITAIALTCGIRSFEYLQQFQPHYLYPDLISTAYHLAS